MVSTELSNSTIYLRECGQCGRHRRIEAADSTGADAVGVAGQRAPASRNGCAHMYLCRCEAAAIAPLQRRGRCLGA